MVEVLLRILLSQEDDINIDLDIRHILADTIENRGWAIVVEEGTGETGFELYLDIEESQFENNKKEIIELTKALGFLKYEFTIL